MALDVNLLKNSLTAIYTATTNTSNASLLANAICNYMIPITPASTGVESGRAQVVATFNSFANQPNGHITSLLIALPVYTSIIASGMSPGWSGTPPAAPAIPDFTGLFKSCTDAELSHADCANVIASAIHNWMCTGTATSNTDSTTVNWGTPVAAVVPTGKRKTLMMPAVIIEAKPKPKVIQKVVQKFNNVKNTIKQVDEHVKQKVSKTVKYDSNNIPSSMEGCARLGNVLNEEIIKSTIVKNAYGGFIKGKVTFIRAVERAYSNLQSQGIQLSIGDTYRSYESQKNAYLTFLDNMQKHNSGQDWIKNGKTYPAAKKPANTAHPCEGYHVRGQAMDIEQSASQRKDIQSHGKIYNALYDAGLRRIGGEWWHWGIGEADHAKNKKFPGDTI